VTDASAGSAATLGRVAAQHARIRASVLAWYARSRREFPWRGLTDPYAVLVSEVMLQQTQASRVAERFPRFLRRFPAVEALASASDAEVLAEWSGLGYNRRALALRAAASIVARDGWPTTVDGLQRLPGVGPYTARAMASLAFGNPVGVVDTNVRRWLLRRFGGPDQRRSLQARADALAAAGRGAEVAAWTHASMELGAAICRARAPRCTDCPVADGCPSRDAPARVAVPKQASMRGSDRAYRGALLKRLSAAPRHRMAGSAARAELASADDRIGPALDDAGWERILAGLERDRLAHRHEGEIRLGAARIAP
jgi:A/G-specific adenine glycosylase